MDNLELDLKNLQGKIDSVTKMLTDAQNAKLTAEVHLQSEQQELDNLTRQLSDMTGLTDFSQIEAYVLNQEAELNAIMQDLDNASSSVNENYTFGENDVRVLKDIVDRYNIPLTGD